MSFSLLPLLAITQAITIAQTYCEAWQKERAEAARAEQEKQREAEEEEKRKALAAAGTFGFRYYKIW